jgi:hypothetical protein
MLPIAFMLAAQAGGMIIDYYGRSQSSAMAKEGAEMQQQAIERAIQYSRLNTEAESLQAMQSLRKNLGSQAVMFASRGIRQGAGSNALFANESVGNYNMDERMRRLNQLSNESKMRAGIQASKSQQQAFENENWNAFTKSIINKIPTNPDAYKGLAESFGFNKVSSGRSSPT